MSAPRLFELRRRALVAIAVLLLISAYAGVSAVRRAQEFEVPVDSYQVGGDPGLLNARVEVHPDFEVVRTNADDRGDRVVLHVVARQPTLWWSGGDHAETRWVRVRLGNPLGDRQVVDSVTGNLVPRG
ncbi:hypothetical protein ABZ541_13220 [Micromonospora sediminicola]|uniref:hypothetical protein n=1 Tax=Micromonospora sediminicola TaxID=946078 RepID=UPI003404CF64